MSAETAATATAEALAGARRVVIKIGSSLLVDGETGALRQDWLRGLGQDVAELRAGGRNVILVSSGSISLGRRILGLPAGELSLEQSQASAAVGQIRLAQAYQAVLAEHGITAAQVLVTLEDSENRRRYLNSRATLGMLLDLGAVPIVNENDTVATDEIRYGDNDRLAAQVTSLAGADLLILLSDVDGLYTANPRADPDARHLPVVTGLTPEVMAMAGGVGSAGARGGMKTKLLAAKVALQAGAAMVVGLGFVDRPIRALSQGARATLFRGTGNPALARKRWIGAMKPKGTLRVDDGAARALGEGKSLLPAGVTAVEGRFERGDPVDVVAADGRMLARGLAGYDAGEAARIKGHRSSEIPDLLGYRGRSAMVHRDDIVMDRDGVEVSAAG